MSTAVEVIKLIFAVLVVSLCHEPYTLLEIFSGYGFTWGEFSIFLSIFAWALQRCSANVLPSAYDRNIC